MLQRIALLGSTSAVVASSAIGFCLLKEEGHNNGDDDDDDVPENGVLRQVIVVHRHGDRTPIGKRLGKKIVVESEDLQEIDDSEFWRSKLPKDNVVRKLYTRFGFTSIDLLIDENNGSIRGKLTQKGFDELNALGKRLRERYYDRLHFLDPSLNDHNKHLVYLRSTPMSRCVRSELCILSGLFSDEDGPCKVPILLGNPNPSNPWSRETMWPSNRMCKYQMDLIRASRKTWRRNDELDALREKLVDVVGPALGFQEGERVRLGSTMEISHCYSEHGFTRNIPLNNVEDVVEKLQHYFWSSKVNGLTKTTLPLLRITIGRLLNELFEKMSESIESPETSPKWCQFSGHDSTMIPLMVSLGLYDAGWPQYGANIILEIWELQDSSSSSYCVQVFFDGTLQYQMPWSEFCQRMEPLLMSDPEAYDAECKTRLKYAHSSA